MPFSDGTKSAVESLLQRATNMTKAKARTSKHLSNQHYFAFIAKNLHEYVKEYLDLKNLKQGDFARSINLDPDYFSNVLNGNKRPSLELMITIASKINIELFKLFEAPEDKQKRTSLEYLVQMKLNR